MNFAKFQITVHFHRRQPISQKVRGKSTVVPTDTKYQWCSRGEHGGMPFPQIFFGGNAVPQIISGQGGTVI